MSGGAVNRAVLQTELAGKNVALTLTKPMLPRLRSMRAPTSRLNDRKEPCPSILRLNERVLKFSNWALLSVNGLAKMSLPS